jgi:hypothetical protein
MPWARSPGCSTTIRTSVRWRGSASWRWSPPTASPPTATPNGSSSRAARVWPLWSRAPGTCSSPPFWSCSSRRSGAWGYPAFVTYIDEEDNEILQARLLCRERKPLGILFLGSNLAYFSGRALPDISVPCVLVTNSARRPGLSQPLQRLHRRRLRRGLLHPPPGPAGPPAHRHSGRHSLRESDASGARLRGCEQGFAACSLPFDRETQYQARPLLHEKRLRRHGAAAGLSCRR